MAWWRRWPVGGLVVEKEGLAARVDVAVDFERLDAPLANGANDHPVVLERQNAVTTLVEKSGENNHYTTVTS